MVAASLRIKARRKKMFLHYRLIEVTESNIDQFSQGKKRRGKYEEQDKIDYLEEKLEAHQSHLKSLESLLRKLENDEIKPVDIDPIKDNVEYFIENYEDEDIEFDECIYEDFDLDEPPNYAKVLAVKPDSPEPEDQQEVVSAAANGGAGDALLIGDAAKCNGSEATPEHGCALLNAAPLLDNNKAPLDDGQEERLVATMKSLGLEQQGAAVTQSVSNASSELQSQVNTKTAPVNVWSLGANTQCNNRTSTSEEAEVFITQQQRYPISNVNSFADLGPPLNAPVSQTSDQFIKRMSAEQSFYDSYDQSQNKMNPPADDVSHQQKQRAGAGVTPHTSSSFFTRTLEHAIFPVGPNELIGGLPDPFPDAVNGSYRNLEKANGLQSQQLFDHNMPGENDSSTINSTPARPTPSETFDITIGKNWGYSGFHQDLSKGHINSLKYLEQSKKCTESFYSPMVVSAYYVRQPYQTPSYYPQNAMSCGADKYQLLDQVTLFFIFYRMPGTLAQRYAADILKGRSWRYHTMYRTWFKRIEQPNKIGLDFESGAYEYFDYEEELISVKRDFRFEYRFLEKEEPQQLQPPQQQPQPPQQQPQQPQQQPQQPQQA